MAWLDIWFGTSNNCGVCLDGVGQNRKANGKQDEDCVEKGFHFARVKVDRDIQGGREAVGIGYCNSNTWNGLELKSALSRKSSSYFENNFSIFFLSVNLNKSVFKPCHILHWVHFLVNEDLLQYFPYYLLLYLGW